MLVYSIFTRVTAGGKPVSQTTSIHSGEGGAEDLQVWGLNLPLYVVSREPRDWQCGVTACPLTAGGELRHLAFPSSDLPPVPKLPSWTRPWRHPSLLCPGTCHSVQRASGHLARRALCWNSYPRPHLCTSCFFNKQPERGLPVCLHPPWEAGSAGLASLRMEAGSGGAGDPSLSAQQGHRKWVWSERQDDGAPRGEPGKSRQVLWIQV